MGEFTRTFSKKYEVDGCDVTVKFSRMKRKHAMIAAPMINAYNEQAEQGDVDMKAITMEQSMEHMGLSVEILTDCIVGVSGLKIETDNGFEEITHDSEFFRDEVLEGVFFMSFVTNMIGDLISESFARPEEEKKPEPEQVDTSAA